MSMKASLSAAVFIVFAAAGVSNAAEPTHAGSAKPGMHEGMKAGMHGMHGKRCHREGGMMGGHHMSQMVIVPRLPAGNDKLQLQMHAEILQKIGEIEARYAAQLP